MTRLKLFLPTSMPRRSRAPLPHYADSSHQALLLLRLRMLHMVRYPTDAP